MYEKQKHQHSYEVLNEYVSTGPNIIGQIVTATMQKVKCTGCEEDNIRRKPEDNIKPTI